MLKYILKIMKNYVFQIVAAFCFLATLNGQIQNPVKISGTVTDPNGAVIIGARVILLGAPEQTVVTNKDGFFIFNNVPRGDYELKVSADGFSPQTQKISLADRNQNYEIRLSVGESRLTVTAEIGQETERSNVPQAVSIIDQNGRFSAAFHLSTVLRDYESARRFPIRREIANLLGIREYL